MAPLRLPHLLSLTLPDLEYDFEQIHAQGDTVAARTESVARYPGGQNTAFPSMETLGLHLVRQVFEDGIERRLAEAARTGVESIQDPVTEGTWTSFSQYHFIQSQPG